MTKEILAKMLAGLSPDEQKAALVDMGVTAEAEQAEYLQMAASVNTAPITQPVITAPAPVAPPAQPHAVVMPGGNEGMQAVLAQLAQEKTARITAECQTFMAVNAGKIAPAEQTAVQQLFVQLASLDDPAALNQYKASINARPVNHMLTEAVASATAVILPTTGAVDNRTESEKDAAMVTALLGKTEIGMQSVQAMKEGKVVIATNDGKVERPINLGKAFNQFAINAPEGV
jgi:hypothetical protein